MCLDAAAHVRLLPCQHELCPGCCHALFKMDYASVVLCPFCRATVGGFSTACC